MDSQPKEIVQQYFRHAADAVGGTGYKLHKATGVGISTINRILSGKGANWIPTTRTLRKIQAGSGIAVPIELLGTGSDAEANELLRIYRRLPKQLRAALVATATALESQAEVEKPGPHRPKPQ